MHPILLVCVLSGAMVHVDSRGVSTRILTSDENFVHNTEVKIQELTQKVEELSAKVTSQDKTIVGLQQIIGNQSQQIYFDAYLGNTVGNLGKQQTIVFDTISSNMGNRYNPTTGQFTCNRPGSYVFYCRLLVHSGVPLYTEIVKNGNWISHMFTHNVDTWGHSSTMAVQDLQPGDIVWVRTHGYQDHSLSGDNILDRYDSSFSGFLLHPDY